MLRGIDVSTHNGTIDWKKIKDNSSDVDFVIIRAGYGKLASQKDKQFENNYKGCKENGIPCGTYWYSYATSVEEIKTEADVFLSVIAGKQFEYPVYLDFEEKSQFALGRTMCSEMAKAFLKKIEEAGYYAGLYCSKSHLEDSFTDDIKKDYTIWLAHYTNQTNYSGAYDIWQYTDDKYINGASGHFDGNYCYKDFPSVIKRVGLNGFKKVEEPKEEPKEEPVEKPVEKPVGDKKCDCKDGEHFEVQIGDKTYQGYLKEVTKNG